MSDYIIVIDDSPTIRTSVEYSVKSLGFPVKQAENGQVALDVIREIKKDGNDVKLCICDVNMPIMDGVCFVSEFRKSDKFTPIIMLTTESGLDMVKKGKEAGASCWMTKPFRPEELVGIVKKLVV